MMEIGTNGKNLLNSHECSCGRMCLLQRYWNIFVFVGIFYCKNIPQLQYHKKVNMQSLYIASSDKAQSVLSHVLSLVLATFKNSKFFFTINRSYELKFSLKMVWKLPKLSMKKILALNKIDQFFCLFSIKSFSHFVFKMIHET